MSLLGRMQRDARERTTTCGCTVSMVVTRLIVDSLCNFRVQYNTATRLDWEQGVYGSESD